MRRTIKDAVKEVGISASALRSWERRGLITPRRDWRGARVFTEEDIQQLRRLAGYAAQERGKAGPRGAHEEHVV